MTVATLIDRLSAWSHLQAESAGLGFPKDGRRIREIAVALGEIEQDGRLFNRNARPAVMPLYWSVDDGELTGGYVQGEAEPVALATGILDLIAARICEEAPLPIAQWGDPNWHVVLHILGEAVIEPCIAATRAALLSARREHVRLELHSWPLDDHGDEQVGVGEQQTIVAPLGTDDNRFDEAGITTCAADAEHATPITRFDLDEDLFAPARAIVEQRGQAAKRALRGIEADGQ